MKTISLIISCIFLSVSCLVSQTSGPVLAKGKTRAVVIGISDYQDERISDLKYAHKDALAFASFLESSSGGKLKKDVDYKLLINEQATSSNMANALDWLLNVSKPKDKAIIYFSGHGDVESQTSVKHGFLLTHDSPSKVYISRAYPVFYLQSIVKTLSGKDIDVLLIADACRSGKLAGSEHNGSQAASSVLAQQLAKEIKILSCQTDEYSEESEAWGGGRGLFSYFLIQGLYGMADRNEDKEVTLMELTSYLTDKVSSHAKKSQIPKTDGSPRKVVSKVDDAMVAKIKSEPESQPLASAEVTTRGMSKPIDNAKEKVKELLDAGGRVPGPPASNANQALDAEINEELKEAREILTNEFWYALDNAHYTNDSFGVASDYLFELIEIADDEESVEQVYMLGAELVWAMRDHVDEVINANLATEFFYTDDIDESLDMVDEFAMYMESAIEILGEDHYMTNHLRAKELYLKALGDALFADIATMDADSLIRQSIRYNLEALTYDDAAAYIYNDLGSAYAALGNNDEAVRNYEMALALSPSWQIALANLYSTYVKTGQFDQAIQVKQRVLELESDNPWIYYSFGDAYYGAAMFDDALVMYNKASDAYEDNYQLINAIGNCYYYGKGDAVNGEMYYRKALEMAPGSYWPSYNLSNLLYATYRHAEAEEIVLSVIDKHDYKLYFYEMLGNIYTATNRWEEGFAAYQKVLDIDYNYASGHINMLYCYAATQQYDLALQWMESGLAYGYNNADYFRTHPVYEHLRTYPKFQELMQQYFGN
jgi:tetratricopeptide (TPR) repeat protein